MKQGRILVLGVVLALAAVAGAQEDAVPSSPVASEDTAARALAVYEQGKGLYDARDYAGALARFDEAAALEPGKARWEYNRGLALKKLGRNAEAREALLRSRALDFNYKRAEIDDKLTELYAAEASESAPVFSSKSAKNIGIILGFLGGMGFLIWLLVRVMGRASGGRASPQHSVRIEDLLPQEEKLRQGAGLLAQVEHALRLGEDADLRARLNQATQAEQRGWHAAERARYGAASLDFVQRQVEEAHRTAQEAVESARRLFGEEALQPGGERVGCYFCARPLANATFRMRVPLKRGAEVTEVLACPPCANMAAAGQPPAIKVRQLHDGQLQHWSELPGYDPYVHRHQPFLNTTTVPAWQYTPSRSLGEVAAIAAGSALATGLAAYGVSQLLDLDSASETAAARAATEAAAKRAGERREERDWKDHS